MSHITTSQELLDNLEIERIAPNVFIGRSHDAGTGAVFGGQVLAQALDAAIQTVPEDRPVHSLHAYFLLLGDLKKTIVFEVDPIRDGGSFTTRRVVAKQDGIPIFQLSASFQLVQEGLSHQILMPNVLPPKLLANDQQILKSHGEVTQNIREFLKERPIEFRPVEGANFFIRKNLPLSRHIWIRAKGKLPDDLRVHRRLLTYTSDYGLLVTAILPHRQDIRFKDLQIASLDHVMWFHRNFRIDDWLLYVLESPTASNSRGFSRGNIFTKEGDLVASVVQEGLIRKRRSPG